jgi:hypothetical protein
VLRYLAAKRKHAVIAADDDEAETTARDASLMARRYSRRLASRRAWRINSVGKRSGKPRPIPDDICLGRTRPARKGSEWPSPSTTLR